ncbi:uncharacterized protein LOC143445910 [Clavelina lepadiformis]|uniref:uncharacterized protein LOC143445910 n=1 Tax=Clavelina lepadiformis TaxID=159417 RepID=UPI0040416A00
MNTVVPNGLTRMQVQEKIKRNFQALCVRCPQLGKAQESLDDSLTSLQWLWNMNVNISNPIEMNAKNNQNSHIDGMLPAFPRSIINELHNNSTLPVKHGASRLTAKTNYTKLRNGAFGEATRPMARVGRKTSAPTPGTTEQNPIRTDTLSAGSIKLHRRTTSFVGNESANQLPGWRPTNKVDAVFQPTPRTSQLQDLTLKGLDEKKNGALPQILPSPTQADGEPLLSGAGSSSSRNYSFSPRQATLDVLPGQVDYKNNPYVKPPFSFTTLIYMAMQNNKRHKMTFADICKWITDSFIYYRYADSEWQNSVKLCLTQSKHFMRVPKKRESSNKSCLWQIDPNYNGKLPDVDSSVMNVHSSSEGSILSSVTRGIATPKSTAGKPEIDDAFLQSLQSRKRKQTTPQKVVRRRNVKKRRDAKLLKTTNNRNLLQEQAPELGSLKGDFNWNSIFEEFFTNQEAQLCVTPTSMASRSSCHDEVDIIGQFSDDVTSGAFLAHDEIILPHLPKTTVNDENQDVLASYTTSGGNNSNSSWNTSNDRDFSSTAKDDVQGDKPVVSSDPQLGSDLKHEFENVEKDDFDTIDGFLKDVGELDLTITGRQIEPPPEWVTECPDLDAILCEKQNDILFENMADVNLDPIFHPLQSNDPDDQNSPRSRNNGRGRKNKRSGASSHRNQDSPLAPITQHSRRPWQEVKDATEAIENILSSSFQM